jgi:hypothetical protein
MNIISLTNYALLNADDSQAETCPKIMIRISICMEKCIILSLQVVLICSAI